MGYSLFEDEETYIGPDPLQKSTRCGSCELYKKCKNPKFKPVGKGKKNILIVAKCPNKFEDKRKKIGYGREYRRLKSLLKKQKIDIKRDCIYTFAVSCHTEVKNKSIDGQRVQCCFPRLQKVIKRTKPKFILLLGETATKSVIGHRWIESIGVIEKWRGHVIPDQEYKAWLFPVYNPAYAYNASQESAIKIFKQDILRFASHVKRNKDIPEYNTDRSKLRILHEPKDVLRYLRFAYRRTVPLFAFDYEATGIKPHAPGHRIVSMSACWSPKFAISFLMRNEYKKILRKILQSPKIGKVGANIKFEEIWSRFKIGTEVVNWVWDTMLFTHVEDNRAGVTGLKFQTYVRYGVVFAEQHVKRLLKGKKNDGNSFNKIHKISTNDLLTYGGFDGLYTRRMAVDQMLTVGILDPSIYGKTGGKRVLGDIENIVRSLDPEA
jgi:uracil-DNA glycosylase family 4